MALSYEITVASGSSNFVSVPFGYLEKSHVHVYINGVETSQLSLVWTSSSGIQLPSTPLAGKYVKVQRFTPQVNPLVTFVAGALSHVDLNTDSLQLLYLCQEAYDLAVGALGRDFTDGAFDAKGLVIHNVATPILDTDAATKKYVNDQILAAAVFGVVVPVGGDVFGPGSSTVGHIPYFSATTGKLIADPGAFIPTRLTSSNGNYLSTMNYGGGSASAAAVQVLGASSVPDSSPDAAAIIQKWSNNTANYAAGINPALYVSNIKKTNNALSRATAGYFEAQSSVSTSATTDFVEGVRGHGMIAAGIAGGNAYGGVFAAGDGSISTTHGGYLIGCEGEVDCNSTDAIYQWNSVVGNSEANHFEACFLATSGGTKKPFAAYMINPFTGVSQKFQVGFFVPPGQLNAPVAGAAFRSDAACSWGLDLRNGVPTFGAIGIPNSSGIYGRNGANTGDRLLAYISTTDQLILGGDAALGDIRFGVGAGGPRATFTNYVDIVAINGVAVPPAGSMRLFVDVPDGKLKVMGPTGTITILAIP